MMPFLIPLLPAIIGAGGGVASSLIGRGGGGGGGTQGLDERAGIENDALRQLLAQIGQLRGQAGQIRGTEQDLMNAIGTLLDFSGLPGLSPEESSFLGQGAAQFEGLQSARPAQNEFARLQSLLGPLMGAAGSGGAAAQSAGLQQQGRSDLAGALGGAAGNVTQFLQLRQLLDQLSGSGSQAQGLSEQLLNVPAQRFDPFGIGG